MDILIIEDEFLLGVLLADALTDAGHRVRGPASCRAEAIALLADQLPQLAFVDIELRGGDSGIELATELKRRGVPCVFATGQPERAREHRAQALGLIAKPYNPMSLSEAARYFEARLAGGPPPRAPRTLELFEIDPAPAVSGGADRPALAIVPCASQGPLGAVPSAAVISAAPPPRTEQGVGAAGVLEALTG